MDQPNSLKLSDLEAFLAVIEHGGQVSASKTLKTSQAGVSRRVRRVAKHFQQGLFVGTTGRLSKAGEDLADRARQALALLKGEDVSKGTLRIGYTSVARAPVVQALKRMHPSIEVRLREANGPEFRDLLLTGELDLAIGYATFGNKEKTEFKQRVLVNQPVDLVVPSERKRLLKRSKATLLSDLRRSFFPPALLKNHYQATGAWLADNDVGGRADKAGECRTAGEMLALIGTGRWFGFLPRMCESSAGPEVTFVRLDDFAYKSGLYEYYWEDESVEEALDAFRSNLKTVLRG